MPALLLPATPQRRAASPCGPLYLPRPAAANQEPPRPRAVFGGPHGRSMFNPSRDHASPGPGSACAGVLRGF